MLYGYDVGRNSDTTPLYDVASHSFMWQLLNIDSCELLYTNVLNLTLLLILGNMVILYYRSRYIEATSKNDFVIFSAIMCWFRIQAVVNFILRFSSILWKSISDVQLLNSAQYMISTKVC